jgi:hypothetical protein
MYYTLSTHVLHNTHSLLTYHTLSAHYTLSTHVLQSLLTTHYTLYSCTTHSTHVPHTLYSSTTHYTLSTTTHSLLLQTLYSCTTHSTVGHNTHSTHYTLSSHVLHTLYSCTTYYTLYTGVLHTLYSQYSAPYMCFLVQYTERHTYTYCTYSKLRRQALKPLCHCELLGLISYSSLRRDACNNKVTRSVLNVQGTALHYRSIDLCPSNRILLVMNII